MLKLWEDLEAKLTKHKRRFEPVSYRAAELYCKDCDDFLGEFDIVNTNLESNVYCGGCVKRFVKDVPNKSHEAFDVMEDFGNDVLLRYFKEIGVQDEFKTCYFNKKGRYVKVKGKRYYV